MTNSDYVEFFVFVNKKRLRQDNAWGIQDEPVSSAVCHNRSSRLGSAVRPESSYHNGHNAGKTAAAEQPYASVETGERGTRLLSQSHQSIAQNRWWEKEDTDKHDADFHEHCVPS